MHVPLELYRVIGTDPFIPILSRYIHDFDGNLLYPHDRRDTVHRTMDHLIILVIGDSCNCITIIHLKAVINRTPESDVYQTCLSCSLVLKLATVVYTSSPETRYRRDRK